MLHRSIPKSQPIVNDTCRLSFLFLEILKLIFLDCARPILHYLVSCLYFFSHMYELMICVCARVCVYIYIYIYASIEIGFRLLPSSLSRSGDSSGIFFAQQSGRNKFLPISPRIFSPFLTEEKEGRLIVARFRRIPGM